MRTGISPFGPGMVRFSTASTSGPGPPIVANCSIMVRVSSTDICPRPGAFIAAIWSSSTCTWGSTGMARIVGSTGQPAPVRVGDRIHVDVVARPAVELDLEAVAPVAGQYVDVEVEDRLV